jgi:uncharacterized protein HemY
MGTIYYLIGCIVLFIIIVGVTLLLNSKIIKQYFQQKKEVKASKAT